MRTDLLLPAPKQQQHHEPIRCYLSIPSKRNDSWRFNSPSLYTLPGEAHLLSHLPPQKPPLRTDAYINLRWNRGHDIHGGAPRVRARDVLPARSAMSNVTKQSQRVSNALNGAVTATPTRNLPSLTHHQSHPLSAPRQKSLGLVLEAKIPTSSMPRMFLKSSQNQTLLPFGLSAVSKRLTLTSGQDYP